MAAKTKQPVKKAAGAKTTTTKKQAIDAPRGQSTFKPNPFEVVVLGVDTSDPVDSDLLMLLHKHRITKPLEQDMLDSISANGLEHAITLAKLWLPAGMTVRGRVLKQEEQFLVVIDGRRRTLHVRELCIKAGDKDGTKKAFALKAWPPKTGMTIRELTKLSSELNDTSRHDDVLEKADEARLRFARTQDKAWVASSFHVDVQTIDGWLKLRGEAAPAVLNAVRTKRGGITASGATKLTRLPPSKQVEVMEEAISKGKTSAKDIDGLVRKAVAQSNGVKPAEQPNGAPTKRKLGACIQVIENAELDDVDDMVPFERNAADLFKYCKDGIIANKRIAEIDRKADEYLKRKGGSEDEDGPEEDVKAIRAAKAARTTATVEKG